jgi:hypothetical protein
MELVVTITSKGVKDFSSCTLRMNADQGREAVNVSEDQGQNGFEAFLAGLCVGMNGLEG